MKAKGIVERDRARNKLLPSKLTRHKEVSRDNDRHKDKRHEQESKEA